MVGMAVKVTLVPAQIVVADAEILTLTGRFGFTFTDLIICAEGPLQPFAVTCMLTVPEKPLVQVMTPVVAPILPANPLLRLQLKPVLFVAVVA